MALPTSTTNMTGFLRVRLGSSLTNDCKTAQRRILRRSSFPVERACPLEVRIFSASSVGLSRPSPGPASIGPVIWQAYYTIVWIHGNWQNI